MAIFSVCYKRFNIFIIDSETSIPKSYVLIKCIMQTGKIDKEISNLINLIGVL